VPQSIVAFVGNDGTIPPEGVMPLPPVPPPEWRTLYQTGFEQPDFAPGGVGGQGGWTLTSIGGASAQVSNSALPALDGVQWVNASVPGTAGFKSAGAQHSFPDVAGKPYRVSASYVNASTPIVPTAWRVQLGSASSPAIVALNGNLSITVNDSAGPAVIGATWAYGVRQNVVITVSADRTAWTLTLNGVVVYTGVPVNVVEPDVLAISLQKTSGLTAWEANFDTVAVEVFS
jgi:hypothetical protein